MNQTNRSNIVVGVLSVAFLCVGLFIAGCHRTTSTNPAVVRVVTLLDAENTVNAIAHGLAEANGTVAGLRANEPEYYEYVHQRLVGIAFLNDKANADILMAKNGNMNVDWRASVAAIAQSVGDTKSLTTFGFKNPKSQKMAQLGLAALITALGVASQYTTNTTIAEGPLPAGCSAGCGPCGYCSVSGNGVAWCVPRPKCSIQPPFRVHDQVSI